ncbi:MAG: radical SAM protein [Elusimicrobia bacterium]|nr:radical SAM protein [Elusimicrobiota bacterium]
MKVLMVETPTAERDGSVPFGLLYAASAARRAGHDVRILDLVRDERGLDAISDAVAGFQPDIVGLGGITSSYKTCKDIVGRLKSLRPGLPVVAGGVIASIPRLLLERAGVDFVAHGEAERTFPELLAALAERRDPESVPGLSFLKDGKIVTSASRPQMPDLDEIPMPDFDLLDMPRYLQPIAPWLATYFPAQSGEFAEASERAPKTGFLLPIVTARGCTHRCIFCYRHHRGWRQNSVGYVVSMMKHLHQRYGVTLFQINDELTTARRSWVNEFCDTLRRERLGVAFIILSSRVDNVDEELLKNLRTAGCLMINYGYESGSDPILREIRKGVSREQALRAGLLTRQAGIKNIPEIIIGFPSETDQTVSETIEFLKRLDTWPISVNTPIPFPETPLWQTAVERGLIRDAEEFVLGYRRGRFVNFTAYPDATVRRWVTRVWTETRAHWLERRGRRWPAAAVRIKGRLKAALPPRVADACGRIAGVLRRAL